jgi:hypothetical protein
LQKIGRNREEVNAVPLLQPIGRYQFVAKLFKLL